MQNLQSRADDLKGEQMRLRQIINEKNIAGILVRLFAKSAGKDETAEDPLVEQILLRPAEETPDATRVPELPALILPGQHASKKIRAMSTEELTEVPSDGIDYDLLGKDRATCTPEELDLIRRERNRMHAKRTRDRKRLFTEQMSEICRQLEDENQLLITHLSKVDPDYEFVSMIPAEHVEPTVFSPKRQQPPLSMDEDSDVSSNPSEVPSKNQNDQLNALLQAVDAFERPRKKRNLRETQCEELPRNSSLSDIVTSVAQNLVALSDDSSEEGDAPERSTNKRQRVSNMSLPMLCHSMTSQATAFVGC